MLSNELMGLGALGILWVNTLLVMGAAFLELRRIAARRALLRPLGPTESGTGLVHAEVLEGDGPDGAFAERLVEQIGRSTADDRHAIAFADRTYRSAIHGGRARAGDGSSLRVVAPGEGASAEVWIDDASLHAAAACVSDDVFDRAYAEARKARGHARTVSAPAAKNVWIAGDVRRDTPPGETTIRALAEGPLLVATTDPRAWCSAKIRLIAAFLIAVSAAAAACTAMALSAPLFGTTSTIGGALGLGYFLLVQPAGTALREAVRFPHVAALRGGWVRGSGGAPVRRKIAPAAGT